MNNLENDFANHVGEAEVLKSTLRWYGTMTAVTAVVTALVMLAVAAWEIT